MDHSYRAMLLIHQYVRGRKYRGTRGMKEHLTREFEYSRDLYVRRSGRLSDDERDVLPDDVGLNAHGKGKRLSVEQVTELGRQAASEAGHDNPTSNLAIPYGLYKAAKMHPLEISPEEVPALVRMALFEIDSIEDELSEEFVDIVTERLPEAIQRHHDDSREEFDTWFVGPGSSLVKQIAQQKSKRGGKLPREEVRRALLHIGWKAYEYVGQCFHALMRTIKNAMPDPLSDEERQLFERMHERQPNYGNLPLALLAERASFLQLGVLAIWEDPTNQDHVPVLHRLLAYYAEMAPSRREADRRSKQRRQSTSPTSSKGGSSADPVKTQDAETRAEDSGSSEHRRASKKVGHGLSVQFIENLHSSGSVRDERFDRVAEHIRELRQITCAAACEPWEYYLEDESKRMITIRMGCECGQTERKIQVPKKEFASHAKRILGRRISRSDEAPADGAEDDAEYQAFALYHCDTFS
ncbi:MAG TPA: hypothetical protein VMY37_28350 [Thermoguttaceae bacterium]|nr:hypothetical protein [Thermoguttaceae bacterium]